MASPRAHSHSQSPLFLALLLLSCAPVAQSVASCYYPDGGLAANDTPCDITVDGNTTHATCCGYGYACMSNHMCKATGEEAQKPGATIYVRGSCTDSGFHSSDCPKFCINPNDPFNDNMSGGAGIGMCAGDGSIFYCIDGASTDCTAGTNVLVFNAAPTPITTIGITPTSSSSSSSTTPPATTTGSGSNSPTTNPDSSDSNSSTVGIAVGVSVGAVGIIAAAIFAFFLFRRRRNTGATALPSHATSPDSSHAGPGAPTPSTTISNSTTPHNGHGISPMTPGWTNYQNQGPHDSVSVISPEKGMGTFYSPNPQDYNQYQNYYQYQAMQPQVIHEAHGIERVEAHGVERVEAHGTERVEAFSTERIELPDTQRRELP